MSFRCRADAATRSAVGHFDGKKCRISVRLEPEMFRRVVAMAVAEDKAVGAWIEDLINDCIGPAPKAPP